MEQSLRHLQEMAIFAKVGEIGSISGAARAMGLPKSTVSRAVARLESGFEARLIERTTRHVTLTEIGRSLHIRCQNLVKEAQEAEAEIAAHQGRPSGLLRVAVPYAPAHVILKHTLPEFLQRHPGVDLQLQLTDRILNPVTDDLDVVIRAGWLEDSAVIARKIIDIDLLLCASRSYVEAHGLPTTLEELGQHAIIGFPVDEPRVMTLSSGSEQVKVPIWSRFACNDPLMNMEFVQRGIAIAPLSTLLASGPLASGEMVHVLPKYSLSHQPAVYALYAGRTALSPKIAVFLDYLTELAARVRADPKLLRM